MIREFLKNAEDLDDYPSNTQNPGRFRYDPNDDDEDVRKVCRRVLRARKGSGYAQRLVELCREEDLPDVIVEALDHISQDLPNVLAENGSGEEVDGADEA